jgi:hypothetical protein
MTSGGLIVSSAPTTSSAGHAIDPRSGHESGRVIIRIIAWQHLLDQRGHPVPAHDVDETPAIGAGLVAVGIRARVGQHHRAKPMRRRSKQRKGDVAPHRQPADARALHAEIVQQLEHIAGIIVQ